MGERERIFGTREKQAHRRKGKIHKRVYMSKRTSLLLTVMNELMQNDVFDEFIELCLLYGMAYLNDKNKLQLVKWTDQLVLPSLNDVENILLVDDDNE